MNIKVHVHEIGDDQVTAARKFLGNRANLHKVMAAGARPVVQRHLVRLAGTNRNPYGARSTFYARMLAGTRSSSDEAAATIALPREMNLRFYGGTVTPKKAKMLAIPADAEAYGKSPRDFSDLRFEILGRGGPALVRNASVKISFRTSKKTGKKTLIKGKDRQGGTVMFWLRKKVVQRGDKGVLPTDTEILEGAAQGITDKLAALGVETE
jgi:hypothetical protein